MPLRHDVAIPQEPPSLNNVPANNLQQQQQQQQQPQPQQQQQQQQPQQQQPQQQQPQQPQQPQQQSLLSSTNVTLPARPDTGASNTTAAPSTTATPTPVSNTVSQLIADDDIGNTNRLSTTESEALSVLEAADSLVSQFFINIIFSIFYKFSTLIGRCYVGSLSIAATTSSNVTSIGDAVAIGARQRNHQRRAARRHDEPSLHRRPALDASTATRQHATRRHARNARAAVRTLCDSTHGHRPALRTLIARRRSSGGD